MRIGPLLRLALRVFALTGLKSFALGVASTFIPEGQAFSLSYALHMGNLTALFGTLIFGTIYVVIAIVVAIIFGSRPNARKFKLILALAMVAVTLPIIINVIENAIRYPASYELITVLWWIVHGAVVVGISQIVARKYIQEVLSVGRKAKAR